MLGGIPQFFADGQELFIHGVAQLGAGGIGEAGAATLAAVAVEGELAHHHDLPLHRLQTQIHLAVFILENPQTQRLFRQIPALALGVVGANAQQNQKALPDAAHARTVNGDGGGFYSCQYSAHYSSTSSSSSALAWMSAGRVALLP